MRCQKILLLGLLIILSVDIEAKFKVSGNRLDANLIQEIMKYELYLTRFSKGYHLTNYVITVSHHFDGAENIYDLAAIYYPFQVKEFNPSSVTMVHNCAILVRECVKSPENTILIKHIDSLYFSDSAQQFSHLSGNIRYTDSIAIKDNRTQHPKMISKDSVYILDTGKSQFLKVLPKEWTLKFKNGVLIKKTISEKEIHQQ